MPPCRPCTLADTHARPPTCLFSSTRLPPKKCARRATHGSQLAYMHTSTQHFAARALCANNQYAPQATHPTPPAPLQEDDPAYLNTLDDFPKQLHYAAVLHTPALNSTCCHMHPQGSRGQPEAAAADCSVLARTPAQLNGTARLQRCVHPASSEQ